MSETPTSPAAATQFTPSEAHAALMARARQVMPGGVTSTARFNQALQAPFYVSRAVGSKLYDLDGREYIDLCCSHGASLLGHRHPAIVEALAQAAEIGYACSAEFEAHVQLAEQVCQLIPCSERVRFCTSGSEATLHLLRVCRAVTGRDKVMRIVGHFHGYHEFLYIGGQPPMDKLEENFVTPYLESPGIPAIMRSLVVPVPFNDLAALEVAVQQHGQECCALVLEPVNFNSGGIQPDPGYLPALRDITRRAGMLLFFDEVQASFKKSPGGAQQDFGVTPDVCTIGKSLGGGMPLSAFCGAAAVMDQFQPAGPVQHSGTFNAHLIQTLAGLAFVNQIRDPGFYPRLEALGRRLYAGFDDIVQRLGVPVCFPHHGARFNLLMGLDRPARNYSELKAHDRARTLAFIRESIMRGVYWADYGGGPAHHGFSIQHTEADIDRVLQVTEDALRAVWL